MTSDIIRAYLPDPLHPRHLEGACILPCEDPNWAILHADTHSYTPLVPIIAHRQRTQGQQADLSCEQARGRRRMLWYDYVRPFLWYRSLSAIQAELKRWSAGESHPLEAIRWQSPWGRLISIGMLEDESPSRAFSVNSEREGGILLEQMYAQSVLSAQALAYGIFWQGEEGWPVFWCASAEIERTIIRYEHPEWSYLQCPIEIHRQEAVREIDLFFPEYFARRERLSTNEKND